MEKRNKTSDMIIVGFALFSIFFGAGNLIFPPLLGHMSGTNFLKAMFGFLLTDPVLPIIGVLATLFIGGKPENMGKRVHPTFAKILGALAIIIIGPLFAVPRTSATTFDIAIAPNIKSIPLWAFSAVFFLVTYLLMINETGVVDAIGKYLTPGLLVVLTIIIIKAIATPSGAIMNIPDDNFFFKGFSEGYQTMDAVGAPLMVGIVMADLLNKGYKTKREQIPVAVGASVVTFILLAVVYGGLTYVGAQASSVIPQGTERIPLLLQAVAKLLGRPGAVVLGLAIALACITTSVGLCSVFAQYFSSISNGKLTYKQLAIFAVVASYIVSLLGTENIIKVAVPVLSLLYPMYIVLFALSLLDKNIKYDLTYVGGVIGAFAISLPMAINLFYGIAYSKAPLDNFLNKFPFGKAGFPWLVPAVVGAIIGTIIALALGDKAKTRAHHTFYNEEFSDVSGS